MLAALHHVADAGNFDAMAGAQAGAAGALASCRTSLGRGLSRVEAHQ